MNFHRNFQRPTRPLNRRSAAGEALGKAVIGCAVPAALATLHFWAGLVFCLAMGIGIYLIYRLRLFFSWGSGHRIAPGIFCATCGHRHKSQVHTVSAEGAFNDRVWLLTALYLILIPCVVGIAAAQLTTPKSTQARPKQAPYAMENAIKAFDAAQLRQLVEAQAALARARQNGDAFDVAAAEVKLHKAENAVRRK